MGARVARLKKTQNLTANTAMRAKIVRQLLAIFGVFLVKIYLILKFDFWLLILKRNAQCRIHGRDSSSKSNISSKFQVFSLTSTFNFYDESKD